MAARDTDYPAWLQADGTLLWVAPMSAQNTQLRYGQYRRLFVDTLRPARDDQGQPLLGFTTAGSIRGQVMQSSGPRHVDVYAKRRAGTKVELTCAHRTKKHDAAIEDLLYASWRCEITAVRAQRLADLLEIPAMLEWPPEQDWSKPDAKRAGASIAGPVWDAVLAAMIRPIPRRFVWAKNPWVWIHRARVLE